MGNSIIGADVLDSMPSSSSGLFDASVEPEIIRNEIAKCIQMAKGGIHAVVIVLSVRTRFSHEEALVIECLKQFFGGKIGDYMIVVFAHGDALGNISLADYLGHNCPDPLRKILDMCGNRYVLFDNSTEDELKKSEQQKELLRLVDTVVLNNGGIPYSNELFVDSPDICEYELKFNKEYEELLLEKIESKLRESTLRVEKQLADEQAARKQAEAKALEAQQKSIAEISRLSEQLEISRRDAEELRKTQAESEENLKKEFKAKQEKLEQYIKKKLEEAHKEAEVLRKSRKESENKLNESRERFEAEQRRLNAEIQNKGFCAIM